MDSFSVLYMSLFFYVWILFALLENCFPLTKVLILEFVFDASRYFSPSKADSLDVEVRVERAFPLVMET